MSNTIRLILVDDHELVRAGLVQFFSLSPDIRVVAEASNGAMLLEKLCTTAADLILLDLSMPGLCDSDLITHLRSAYPALPILVLSMHNQTQTVLRALKAGASGFISKNCSPQELKDAIRKIIATGKYLSPDIAQQIALATATGHPATETPLGRLSERELQIFHLLAEGASVGDIAHRLSISDKTVSTHKSNLLRKLALKNIAELVRYAVNYKLHR